MGSQDHLHTGFITFVAVTVYAVVGINVLRLLAAQMVGRPGMEPVGKVLGSLVNFGSPTA